MSYDDDSRSQAALPGNPMAPMDPCDLAAIVCFIDLAALSLTNKPGDTFTFEQLYETAVSFDPALGLREQDVRIVVGTYDALCRRGKTYWLR